jgi:hypothetical protein
MNKEKDDDLEDDIYGIDGENFDVDINDPIYKEFLELEEPKLSDPEFSNVLMNIQLGVPSEALEDRLMILYRKHMAEQ